MTLTPLLIRAVAVLLAWLPSAIAFAGAPPASLPHAGVAGPARFALVMGNSNYSGEGRDLKNSANDARLMTQTLRKLGFDVKQYVDLDRSQMVKAVADFADGLPEGATAWVYYAGHGMQIGGASYLLPVDMVVSSEQSVPLRAYPLKSLMERLAGAKSVVNVVVLDACRDNPFQPPSPVRYRGFANLGLAPVQAPRGSIVAYSTAPGQLAADGPDTNSVYTATLAQVIVLPQLSLEAIFKRTGDQVRKKTLDNQIPWFESSLTEEFYFQPPEGVTVVAGHPLQPAGNRSDYGRQRGVSKPTASPQELPWYRALTEYEWNDLDHEIQQRVKWLTMDALPKLEHQATGGSVVAQTTLGLAWREGVARASQQDNAQVTRYQSNNTKAVAWLQKAAQAGFPIAQTELAEMQYTGQGMTRNRKQAQALLEQAAQAAYPRAKLDLLQLQLEASSATGAQVQSTIQSLMR